jgi:hypothetical protein
MAQHPAHAQDYRHPGQASPASVDKALQGVEYPTTREHLVSVANSRHADPEIVALFARLPDKNYDSASAISREIARTQ